MFNILEQLSHYRHCGCAFRRNLQQRSINCQFPKPSHIIGRGTVRHCQRGLTVSRRDADRSLGNRAGWSVARIWSHLIHYHIAGCFFPVVIPDERHSILRLRDAITSLPHHGWCDSVSGARGQKREQRDRKRDLFCYEERSFCPVAEEARTNDFPSGFSWIINYYHEQRAFDGIGNASRLWCYGGRHGRCGLVRQLAGDSHTWEVFVRAGAGSSSGWSVTERGTNRTYWGADRQAEA